jgi:hypothetical protein
MDSEIRMTDERDDDLVPARPDEGRGARREFAQRLPWPWILGGTLIVGAVGAGYWIKRERDASAIRAGILAVHDDQLAGIADRYTRFRQKLERWIVAEATRAEPEAYVDPRLKIAGLGAANGLYLRLRAADATRPERIAEAALAAEPDAITRCMGITAGSARGLYQLAGFLGPELVERANATSSVLDLRVIDDELRRRVQRDLPPVVSMMRADWFMLVIERGETRRSGAVDVYLWDLRTDEKLLSARTRPNGVLVPVRVDVPGAPPSPRVRPNPTSAGAVDCSIAAQVKALTGEPALDFAAELPGPDAPSVESADAASTGAPPANVDPAGQTPADPRVPPPPNAGAPSPASPEPRR